MFYILTSLSISFPTCIQTINFRFSVQAVRGEAYHTLADRCQRSMIVLSENGKTVYLVKAFNVRPRGNCYQNGKKTGSSCMFKVNHMIFQLLYHAGVQHFHCQEVSSLRLSGIANLGDKIHVALRKRIPVLCILEFDKIPSTEKLSQNKKLTFWTSGSPVWLFHCWTFLQTSNY